MKKIIIVVGARPNYAKIACLYPLLREDFDVTLINTGQHADANMSGDFIKEFKLEPMRYLNPYSNDFEGIYGAFRAACSMLVPDLVIVVGDVMSTLACAFAAKSLDIYPKLKVAHIEAGCRSGNMDMPEEINRVAVDSIADHLFCITESDFTALRNHPRKSYLVGNTMLDSLKKFISVRPGGYSSNYCLATIHRRENILTSKGLQNLYDCLDLVIQEMPVIFPMHPHTRKMLGEDFKYFEGHSRITIKDPVPYGKFMGWLMDAAMVFTDSGGLQVEANYFSVPCITFRNETEHFNTLRGTNRLAVNPEIVKARLMEFNKGKWTNYLTKWDDGKASERIAAIIRKIFHVIK